MNMDYRAQLQSLRANRASTVDLLRRHGLSLREIGERLGISAATAHADLRAHVEPVLREAAGADDPAARAMAEEKLDRLELEEGDRT